jgi:hypothetical protein
LSADGDPLARDPACSETQAPAEEVVRTIAALADAWQARPS